MTGDIDIGSVDQASGVAVGSNNQAVNVTISAPLEPPNSLREQIRQMWVIVASDQLERKDRQKETDEHRTWVQAQLSQLRTHIWVLTAAVAVTSIAVAVLCISWWF